MMMTTGLDVQQDDGHYFVPCFTMTLLLDGKKKIKRIMDGGLITEKGGRTHAAGGYSQKIDTGDLCFRNEPTWVVGGQWRHRSSLMAKRKE